MLLRMFFVLALCGILGPQSVVAQGTGELKSKVLNEWKKLTFPPELLSKGIYFEITSPSEGKCKVHLGTDYLHAETKEGIFVYSKKYVFGLKKRANGYSLVQMFTNDFDKGKEAQVNFSKQMIGLQSKFGPIFTQLFPIEVPGYFNFLIRTFSTSWNWLEKSPFVQIESVESEKNGLIRLVYSENSTKQYGDKGSWRKGDLIIDPKKGFNVIREDWTSLNPNLVANGSTDIKYEYFEGGSGPWVITGYQKVDQIQGRAETIEKISYSNYRTESLDPEKLKITFYDIPEPAGIQESNFYYYLFGFLTLLIILILVMKFGFHYFHRSTATTNRDNLRNGFTILELLVVIAICSILLGLSVSAIQKVRSTSAKLECTNNLRQIGLAIHSYYNVHNHLPSGHRSFSLTESIPYSGWTLSILPEIGEDNLYKTSLSAYQKDRIPFIVPPHTPLSTPIKQFSCPSDSRTNQKQWCKAEGLEIALTSYLGVSGISGSDNSGVFFPNSAVSFSEINDGLSNTIFIGERPPSQDLRFGWWYAGSGFNFKGLGDLHLGSELILSDQYYKSDCVVYDRYLKPNSFSNPCSVFGFWSLHSNGSNFLFGDSSVRFIDTSNQNLLNSLATKNGGELINNSQ